MRKRRPQRRPHRLRFQRPVTTTQRMLLRAHRSMELGEHANAAALFEKVAREAHDQNKLSRAPRLYFQSARSYVLAGDIHQAEAQIWVGFDILISQRNWGRLDQIGQRIIHELEEWDQPQLARNIKKRLQKSLPDNFISTQVEWDTIQIPWKCTSCGGAIRSQENEGLDIKTIECPYCGSAIPIK